MSQRTEHDELQKIHPVHLRKVIYPTKASEDLFVQLESAVLARAKGFVVLEKPLMGLTTAIRLAASGWKTLYSDIPFVVVRSSGAGKYTAHGFWASLVSQAIPNLASSRHQETLRLRLLHNFVARALSSKTDRILLVIDRAHYLHPEDLSQIAAFQDDLADEGIDLVVVLAGHESLRAMRDDLYEASRYEPVRRYFEKEHQLYGLRNAYDLKYFLESFDKDRFPAGSDWPISRFYYRDMFDGGWRLGHEAASAWSIIADFAGRKDDLIEVEMPYVAEMIGRVRIFV